MIVKKMLNILFYLMIMIQMFNFAMPVMADEKEKIEILSLKQGNIELVQDDDGVYRSLSSDLKVFEPMIYLTASSYIS